MQSDEINGVKVESIVGLIKNWPHEKFTWRLIEKEVEYSFDHISRVSLSKRLEIKIAYDSMKRARKDGSSSDKSKSELLKDNIKLRGQNLKLETIQNIQAQQFQRWIFNANEEGVSLNQLNAPILKVASQ